MAMYAVPNPQRLTDDKRALLRVLLDRLLPPNMELPGAGSMGLDEQVESEALLIPAHGLALHTLLDALPPGFAGMQGEEQDHMLKGLEAAMPEVFSMMVLMAYNAYYIDQRVLKLIEREMGYEARPPQPLGYELKPFDESVLAKIRQRKPFWRQVPSQK